MLQAETPVGTTLVGPPCRVPLIGVVYTISIPYSSVQSEQTNQHTTHFNSSSMFMFNRHSDISETLKKVKLSQLLQN